jgi:hypothetical protein
MAITRVSKPKREKKPLEEPSEKPQRSAKERQLTGGDIIKLYLQVGTIHGGPIAP